MLKIEHIKLPGSLQQAVVNLAHSGSHPGQSGLEYYFVFHNMSKKLAAFNKCINCAIFTNIEQNRYNRIKSDKNLGNSGS